jgi:hypothetical protein
MTETPNDNPPRVCGCTESPDCVHVSVPEQRLAEAILGTRAPAAALTPTLRVLGPADTPTGKIITVEWERPDHTLIKTRSAHVPLDASDRHVEIVTEDLKTQLLADIAADPGTAPADPSAPCYHPGASVLTGFGRIGQGGDDDPTPGMPAAFVLEIHVECDTCGEPFVFDGVPAGLSFDAPSVSLDGRELRAPVRPASLPPRHRRMHPDAPSGFLVKVVTQDTDQ